MTPIWREGFWKLGLASFVAMGGAIASSGNCAHAQVTPDGTLGAESSVVTPTNVNGLPGEQIDGGATRGANLFHSFEQFSIPTGGEANFNNALDIQNIISRVTGLSVSNINGLLRANGTANLFLLNPNGISFGANARLSIGGSFVGSTASSLNFAEGTSFSATAPQATPLLTVSVPIGLQYRGTTGDIQVQGSGQGTRTTTDLIDTPVGLRVEPNQTLAMVGGDVALTGGTLKTAGGRIELGSVAGPGLVSLTPIESGWALGYEGVPTFGDIQLSGAATVDASGAGGGDIQVRGRQVTLQDGSQIEASTLGTESGGTLNVIASEFVEAIGTSPDGQISSALSAQVYTEATGAGGNLTIETRRLSVLDGATVSVNTEGVGAGGTLSVTAADAIELIGTSAYGQIPSGLFATTQGQGDAGDLTIATGRLTVRDGAIVLADTFDTGAGGTLSVTAADTVELIGTSANGQFSSGLFATTQGQGDAGDLTIATGRLTVRDGAIVLASTFGTGAGGTLSVTAADTVELIGTSADGQFVSGLFATTQDEGDAGDLTIATGRLTVRDGAQVGTGTFFGTGAGGTLSVTAADTVELIGTTANGQFSSGLFATTQGQGDAGNLTIATGRLNVRDGAFVSASTSGTGAGGTLSVTAADTVELIGTSADGQSSSGLFATTQDEGDAGDLTIATGRLNVRDGAQVLNTTFSSGQGGNLEVTSLEAVELIGTSADGRPGGLFARTQGAGDRSLIVSDRPVPPPRISLSVDQRETLDIQFSSTEDVQVSNTEPTLTQSTGSAGNLSINTRRLTVKDGAQVSASTFGAGKAGNLTVQAEEVELIGTGTSAAGRFSSGLFTQTENVGDAGDLAITAEQVVLQDGAQVSTTTFGAGQGGNLEVSASKFIDLVGTSAADREFSSGLFSQTQGAEGAGNLTIATGQLNVRDGAFVSVSSEGSGDAGNLEVAANSIRLNNQGRLSAETTSGQGGDITLRSQDFLQLRRNSSISTTAGTAGAGGDGGNITINTPFIIAYPDENSDITANAYLGSGGKVNITAQNIFGLTPRSRQELQSLLETVDSSELDPSRLPSNDITAFSQTNPTLSEQVTFDIQYVDPTQGLVQLPAEVVDVSNQIAQGCSAGVRSGETKFVITGRGGLPPNPHDPLTGDNVLTDWNTLDSNVENRSTATPSTNSTQESAPATIVEANGWMTNDKGEVILTAAAPSASLDIPWLPKSDCNAFEQNS